MQSPTNGFSQNCYLNVKLFFWQLQFWASLYNFDQNLIFIIFNILQDQNFQKLKNAVIMKLIFIYQNIGNMTLQIHQSLCKVPFNVNDFT